MLGTFGPDVRNIDALLQEVCRRTSVTGVALAGFSDGAGYALSHGVDDRVLPIQRCSRR